MRGTSPSACQTRTIVLLVTYHMNCKKYSTIVFEKSVLVVRNHTPTECTRRDATHDTCDNPAHVAHLFRHVVRHIRKR
jgi:hypothetical protein